MASEGIQEIAVTDDSIRVLAMGHLIAGMFRPSFPYPLGDQMMDEGATPVDKP